MLNALLERVPMDLRTETVTEFLATNTPSNTGLQLPGGIRISSDEDLRRLTMLLESLPNLQAAIAQSILAQPPAIQMPSPPAGSAPIVVEAHSPQMSMPPMAAAQFPAPSANIRRVRSDDPRTWPKRPMNWAAAVESYLTQHGITTGTQNKRTGEDKARLFNNFLDFLISSHPELGGDPWVHQIDSFHVQQFLTEQAKRPGKRTNDDGEPAGAAPRTLLKKLSDLSHLFNYWRTVIKATNERIDEDLSTMREAWNTQAAREKEHYNPFTDSHLEAIFKPGPYLAANREPAYFWAPLLGIHLGVRMGDVVRHKIANIGRVPEIGVWYLDIQPEEAKNDNSIRRLPITQPLIDLGFLDYIEHVRALGAKYLFPNCNWDRPTLQRMPSKNASRAFADHLDKVGVSDPKLVFHSFRHTVVTAMQDAGVPMIQAMQIVGHQAQEHAVRTGKVTPEQARSVHVTDYTHAELARMGTEYPILTFKSALEKSLKPPIDYDKLRAAASIVQEHVRKVGAKFKAGWPAQRHTYTQKQVERMEELAKR